MANIYSKAIKQRVRNLRVNGLLLGEICFKTKIAKNTISGWVKDILLTRKQKIRIKNKIIAYSLSGHAPSAA